MPASWLEGFYNILFRKSQNEDLVAYPNLPLTGSLASIIMVNIAYVAFVLRIGPWIMRNREPFKLQKVLMVYNALQVLTSLGLFVAASYYLFMTDYYDLGCISKLSPGHPGKSGEMTIVYIAYLSKYLDYVDTIFFVLRKSYRQVTFLHIYHHLIMSFITYLHLRDYGFGGHCVGAGVINCFVHMVMYGYYFLSAYRPDMKNSIWWKRHITELQILQFLLAFTHQIWPILVRRDCQFSRFWLSITTTQLIVFIILFSNFYKKAYLTNKNSENAYAKTKLIKKAL